MVVEEELLLKFRTCMYRTIVVYSILRIYMQMVQVLVLNHLRSGLCQELSSAYSNFPQIQTAFETSFAKHLLSFQLAEADQAYDY